MWQIIATLSMLMIEGSYLPQVAKLHKTKAARDFNLMFPLFNAGGRLLAMMYTMSRGEWILAVGFIFGLSIRFILLGQVMYYQRHEGGGHLSSWLGIARLTALWERTLSAIARLGYKPTLQPAAGLCAPGIGQSTVCQPETCEEPGRKGMGDGWWQRLCAVVEEQAAPPTQQDRPKTTLRAAICQPEDCGPNEHATTPLLTDKSCRSSKS